MGKKKWKKSNKRPPAPSSGSETTRAAETPAAVGNCSSVLVNDPTIVVSMPKSAAHDIRHFFTRGKDGTKTVCNICWYVIFCRAEQINIY